MDELTVESLLLYVRLIGESVKHKKNHKYKI